MENIYLTLCIQSFEKFNFIYTKLNIILIYVTFYIAA